MRRFLRFVVLGLVLLLVAVLSMLTAMRFAIHGREVAVPKLVGMNDGQAQDEAGRLGLRVLVESRYFSAQYKEGEIIAQSPRAGGKVRRGWVVRVAESLGPQRAVIPNVIGQSQRAAEINITRRGLDVGTTAIVHIPDLPPDEVVAQDPPPAAQESVSPKVNLLVNAPANADAYVMPELVGRRFGEVSQTITSLGMHVAVNAAAPAAPAPAAPDVAAAAPATTVPSPRATAAQLEAAVVIRQSPPPGQKVSPGDTIYVEVSR